ncbi:putative ATP-dependent RNA helicase ucp12 [Phytophthora citrophthora]|uniref:ATP-dependent RNA helicase ucp12 n=1 Tax=Phytophthora citrophthora TaxID=4793 RepID=A0AAD9GN81_9STRA|nr:putative ATP-dependent RNA helicase ucp12 [Phytophthora citrophthora]
MECFTGKRILCTQPRKLAATSLATRVAFEFSAGFKDAKVGRDVGFRVSGSYKYLRRTRIEFVTEAILLDMIIKARVAGTSSENPFANVGCVVIDEAHERSISCDLVMG